MAYLFLVRPLKLVLFIVSLLTAMSAAAAQTTSSSPAPVGKRKAKAVAIHAPAPAYPVDERGHRPTGRGIVVMEIDRKTGWVTSAKMEKSTGSKLLDQAAVEAFRQWRFKAGTPRHVRSPITFTVRGPKL